MITINACLVPYILCSVIIGVYHKLISISLCRGVITMNLIFSFYLHDFTGSLEYMHYIWHLLVYCEFLMYTQILFFPTHLCWELPTSVYCIPLYSIGYLSKCYNENPSLYFRYTYIRVTNEYIHEEELVAGCAQFQFWADQAFLFLWVPLYCCCPYTLIDLATVLFFFNEVFIAIALIKN